MGCTLPADLAQYGPTFRLENRTMQAATLFCNRSALLEELLLLAFLVDF